MFQISISSPKDIFRAQKFTILGGVMIIIWGLLEYLFGGGIHKTAYRLSIPYLNANPFSFYMLSLSLLGLCGFYYQKKKIYLLIFLVFSMFCVLPLTRITIGSWFVSLSLFFFLISKKKIYSIIIMTFILFLMLVVFTSVEFLKKRNFYRPKEVSLINVIKNPKSFWGQLNTAGRSAIWSYSLNRFLRKNPMFGSGVGSTQYVFYGGARRGSSGVMHSEYIRILCELGIVGLCLYVIVFLLYLNRIFYIWRKAKNTLTKQYALISFLCLISFLIICFTDNLIDYIFFFTMYMFSFMAFAFYLFEKENLEI